MQNQPPSEQKLMLFGTEKEYAWSSYQAAFDAGKLLPHRDVFETWWSEVALTVQWKDLHDMFGAAWGAGVQDRNVQCTAGYEAWWQANVIAAQPVIGHT